MAYSNLDEFDFSYYIPPFDIDNNFCIDPSQTWTSPGPHQSLRTLDIHPLTDHPPDSTSGSFNPPSPTPSPPIPHDALLSYVPLTPEQLRSADLDLLWGTVYPPPIYPLLHDTETPDTSNSELRATCSPTVYSPPLSPPAPTPSSGYESRERTTLPFEPFHLLHVDPQPPSSPPPAPIESSTGPIRSRRKRKSYNRERSLCQCEDQTNKFPRHWERNCPFNLIHAPKIPCTQPGCTDKFANKDNLKKHLEKSRAHRA